MDRNGPFEQPTQPNYPPPGLIGPEENSNKPWVPDGVLIGLAIASAVLLVAGAAVGFTWYRGRESDAASVAESTRVTGDFSGGTEPPTSEPEGSVDFELLACPEGTNEVICDAAEYVQLTREKPFKTFPEVELMESEAFSATLLEDYDEAREELEEAELAFKGLGLIDQDADLYEEFREVLSLGVVGFYDPEDGRLVLRGEDLNVYVQSVLVHELVHALDDQWFDLSREFEDDEASYGYTAIIEGNATRVDEAWTEELSSDEYGEFLAAQGALFSPEDATKFLALPQAIIELQSSPYVDGSKFLTEATSSEADIDALLENPPATSERILHPDTSDADDPQVTVEPLDRPDVVDDGKLGEIVVRYMFGAEAATGWEGDSYVVWSDAGRACVAAQVLVESEQDLTQLSAAVDGWVAEEPERSSSPVAEPGVFGVEFTNCSG